MTPNSPRRGPAEISADLAQATEELAALSVTPSESTDLVPSSNLAPDALKKDLAKRHQTLVRAAAKAKALQKELEQSLREQISAANAALAPLQLEIDRLREGIWAVSLYTGRDEQVVLIKDGAPAPKDTPLTIRQMVLAMDEETAAFAGKGGIEFSDFDLIDEWLTDPTNLAQVAPWPKCIVVFRARRAEKDYGDPFINEALNKENMRSHWLLRNGDRLYRMTTDLDVGNRLISRRDEFISLFTETTRNRETGEDETVNLVPGSSAWARAESRQDTLHRHYMRCALVIQGLLDRTPIFQPFPTPAPLSLLREEDYDAGLVKIVSDDEANLLGVGRKPFYEWLRDLNATLHPGMRIIGDFSTDAFRYENEFEKNRYSRHSRLTPNNAEVPPSNVIHRLNGYKADRGERGLVFSYARTREDFIREKSGDYAVRAPKTRATCIIYPHDRFILPFDLVTIPEMQAYLEARTERHAYDEMMPLLRAAIAAKEVEQSQEAPFRDMLLGALSLENNAPIDDALVAFVDQAVSEWKLANKWHRPLVSAASSPDGADAATEAKAVRYIRSLYRRTGEAKGDEEVALARLLETDPTIIYVGRARTGKYFAFAPTVRKYPSVSAPDNAYVTEYAIGGTIGTGAISTKAWQLVGTRANKLRTIFTTPSWSKWDQVATKSTHLTDYDLVALAQRAADLSRAEVEKKYPSSELMAVTYDHKNATFESWFTPNPVNSHSSRVGAYAVAEAPFTRVSWKRRSEGNFDLTIARYVHTTNWSSSEAVPWRAVWDGVSRHRAPILTIESALSASTAVRTKAETSNAITATRHGAVRSALNQLETAWMKNAEAAAKARYMEDYGDAELWEDYLKTLKLRYPYRTHKKGRVHEDDIEKALTTLVNNAVTLKGTLGELLAQVDAPANQDPLEVPDDIINIAIDAPLPRAKPSRVTGPAADGVTDFDDPPGED